MAKVKFIDQTSTIPAPVYSGSEASGATAVPQRGEDHFIQPASNLGARYKVETARLSAPSSWGLAESIVYTLHASVWWTRRLTVSKHDDAQSVADFLVEKNLWDIDTGEATAVISSGALAKLDIKRRFWWISDTQIAKLADGLSAVHRQNSGKRRDVTILVKNAIFDQDIAFRGEQ